MLGMGCAGDRSSPWDGSGRGRPIRCCRPPYIGASACLRKTSGGRGAEPPDLRATALAQAGQRLSSHSRRAGAVAVPSHAGCQRAVDWFEALRRGARYAAPQPPRTGHFRIALTG